MIFIWNAIKTIKSLANIRALPNMIDVKSGYLDTQ